MQTMYNKTKAGALMKKSERIIHHLAEYVDHFEREKERIPERLILTEQQMRDLFDPDYEGEKLFQNIPVVTQQHG